MNAISALFTCMKEPISYDRFHAHSGTIIPQVCVLLLNRSRQQSVSMLLSITATTTLLPLICFVGAVASTEGGGSNRMLQAVALPKITLDDEEVTTWEAINMTVFKWLYSKNVTSLTICTQNALLEENETPIAGPTLLYKPEGGDLKNIEGVVHEGNSNCSLFTEMGNVPLAAKETSYQLNIIAINGNETIRKSGSITFGMPVETSTLTCNNESYTRVARLTSDTTLDFDGLCFNDDQKAGNESVCYLEGEFSSSYLCYTTTDLPELQVCLQGSSLTTADEVDGELTISYLAYGSDRDTAEGHLSLEVGETQPTDGMEAIIWKGGNGFATSCPANRCYSQAFTPGIDQYNVCAVILFEGLATKTSTDTITDLNLNQLPGNPTEHGSVLQFVFANALPEMVYRASVSSSLPSGATKNLSSVEVDCTLVQENHGCFGLLDIKDLATETVYLAVSNANNDTNKVVSPYDSGVIV